MKTRLGSFGRALLIGLAGTALLATTLATSNVRACVKDRALGSDEVCSGSESGLSVSFGPLRIVFHR
jgi:hypothetical protein